MAERDEAMLSPLALGAVAGLALAAAITAVSATFFYSASPIYFSRTGSSTLKTIVDTRPVFDTRAYDAKLLAMSHVATSSKYYSVFLNHVDPGTTTVPLWPKRAAYPNAGALLPFNRIVAYYGNFYSTGMGVLGQYPAPEMLTRLRGVVAQWQAADPKTPVIPAIHYIVETAQGAKSKSGYYIARMPDDQIDHALDLAAQINGVVFIDFQVGTSNVERELPQYEEYLKKPNLHVGIDPEFSMKDGAPPGREIGTMDAEDVNWVIQYLSKIVKDNNLPPKILVVHRFTQEMLTHAARIVPTPEVQVVVDMDGWGGQAKKIGTYTNIVAPEPVQFTGFKLFYKNDVLPPSNGMLSPAQLLSLTPQPLYIQYQ